jgi:hypothetical protein
MSVGGLEANAAEPLSPGASSRVGGAAPAVPWQPRRVPPND